MRCTLLACVFKLKVISSFVITVAGSRELTKNTTHSIQKDSPMSDNKPKCKYLWNTDELCTVMNVSHFDSNTLRLLEIMANIT